MRSLGVIAARGGSKGIPRKNLSMIGEIPLMEFTRRAAVGSKLDRLIVSTEDAEISALAQSIGLEVPFTRPSVLADDYASTSSVMLHAVDTLQAEGDQFDIVVSLDITAPFKLSSDIDECLARIEQGATSANTVCEAEINPYFNMLQVDDEGWGTPLFDEYFTLTRRQDAPRVYRENAVVQAVTVDQVRAGFWPVTDRCSLVEIPTERSVMIDNSEGLIIVNATAEQFLKDHYPSSGAGAN
jgi:CMP-N,N'-diacetyllegionaminic acid synthase